jgi:hypothetical protein
MKATRENSFTIDSDGVDPDLVLKKLLDSGSKIPCIGLGTFGSDKISGEVVAETVSGLHMAIISFAMSVFCSYIV